MLQVNYRLLLNKYNQKSDKTKVKHNSFYVEESHYPLNLSESHGIFVDDYFGFRFTNNNNNIEYKKNRDDDNNAE